MRIQGRAIARQLTHFNPNRSVSATLTLGHDSHLRSSKLLRNLQAMGKQKNLQESSQSAVRAMANGRLTCKRQIRPRERPKKPTADVPENTRKKSVDLSRSRERWQKGLARRKRLEGQPSKLNAGPGGQSAQSVGRKWTSQRWQSCHANTHIAAAALHVSRRTSPST
jgi:hypothetical protein